MLVDFAHIWKNMLTLIYNAVFALFCTDVLSLAFELSIGRPVKLIWALNEDI